VSEEIIEKSALEMVIEAFTSVKFYVYVFIIIAVILSAIFAFTDKLDASMYGMMLFGSLFISIILKYITKEKE